jgi:hypothetical protein
MNKQRVVGVFGAGIGVPFAICVIGEKRTIGQKVPNYPLVKHDTKYIRNPDSEEFDEAWLVWRICSNGHGMTLTEFTTQLERLNNDGKLTRVYITHGSGACFPYDWRFEKYGPETFNVEPNEMWARDFYD